MKLNPLILMLLLGILGLDVDGDPVQFPRNDPKWIAEAVDRHNEFRIGFESPPIRLSHDLCPAVQKHVQELASGNGEGLLEHSSAAGKEYGENLFAIKGPNVTLYGSTPVDRWYDEIQHYNFQKGHAGYDDQDSGTGSFTQVVWRDTTDMCIAYAVSNPDTEGHRTVFVVAHYFPPGNIYGKEEFENVRPDFSSQYFYKDAETAPASVHISHPIRLPIEVKPVDDPITVEVEAVEVLAENKEVLAENKEVLAENKEVLAENATETPLQNVVDILLHHLSKDNEVQIPERSCWEDGVDLKIQVTTPPEFVEGALNFTNKFRQLHKVHTVDVLNPKSLLCKNAQARADHLAGLHSPSTIGFNYKNSSCGEMIFKSGSKVLTPEALVQAWYAEGQFYEFDHHRTSTGEASNNFVRLIWKGTEQMCIAYAKLDSEGEYDHDGDEEIVYVGLVYQASKPNYELLRFRQENIFSNSPRPFDLMYPIISIMSIVFLFRI